MCEHILSTRDLYEMQMCQLSWHWLPYITPSNGHDSRKSSVCAGFKCIFRSQNGKVFVVLSRNHSFNSQLRWIIDFQPCWYNLSCTICILFSKCGVTLVLVSRGLKALPVVAGLQTGMIFVMSGSWIGSFPALALTGAAKQFVFPGPDKHE